MIRSVLAVLAGYVVTGLGATASDLLIGVIFPGWQNRPLGQPPTLFHTVPYVLYTALFAVVGGYLAALIARRLEIRHAIAVGVLGFLLALGPVISNFPTDLTWYKIAVPPLFLAGAYLGGYLRLRQVSKDATSSEVETAGEV